MEAALLTLDVFCIILLLRNLLRVEKTGDEAALGIFRYPITEQTQINTVTGSKQVPHA